MLYYTPPSEKVFENIKVASLVLWSSYFRVEEPSYATEKMLKIAGLANVGDNYMYMVAMFDTSNQMKLFELLSNDALEVVYRALLSVNNSIVADRVYLGMDRRRRNGFN